MGDVTPEMTAANRPLYARAPALALIALAVAGGVVALVLALGGGGGSRARNAQAAAPGEIDLTSLSAQQLRPVVGRRLRLLGLRLLRPRRRGAVGQPARFDPLRGLGRGGPRPLDHRLRQRRPRVHGRGGPALRYEW